MRQLKIQKSITNRSSEALGQVFGGNRPVNLSCPIDEEIELAQAIRKGGT
jgi:RNA polymerase primary sigma factor